jgi:hypothetical protein
MKKITKVEKGEEDKFVPKRSDKKVIGGHHKLQKTIPLKDCVTFATSFKKKGGAKNLFLGKRELWRQKRCNLKGSRDS